YHIIQNTNRSKTHHAFEMMSQMLTEAQTASKYCTNDQIFLFNDTVTAEIYTLSLHDALPISFPPPQLARVAVALPHQHGQNAFRSEEHTSELQSLRHLVCRLLLEKKK